MSGELLQIYPYILVASVAGIAGGIMASFWAPGVKARSAVQHFAAGVVIAAVAAELIPEVEKIGTVTGILGGFAVGGLAMVGLKWLVLRFEKWEQSRDQLPVGLAAAAAVDTLIDGAIISAGFSTTKQLGSLLAVALAIELFFLTLSVGTEFHKKKSQFWQGLAATTGVALMLPVGAAAAFFGLAGASPATVAIFLSFGAAALIYLVAEELLVEAIEAEKSLFSTTMLFAGFFIVLAIMLFSKGHP